MDYEEPSINSASQRDFSRARNRALWSEIWATLTGKSVDLLQFEEVQNRLRLRSKRHLGLQNIPLDKIVGTVGRYHDFTRSFLPRKTVNQERWKRISSLARGSVGFPPIEVYKVGEAYFVIDGNHRVSVARQLGQPTIEAYVTELPTSVPFDEHTTPDELDLKAAYAGFLRETRLDVLRPGADLMLTEPGNYHQIAEHIEVHRYFLGLDLKRDISWDEAVASWYDNVYMPMVEVIREHDLLHEFPKRTEADLYVWLIRHQAALRENYGGTSLSPEDTARDFLEKLD
ncbi:MAG: ParB N-terminal domain-containing protein [Chloroflexi bacterium]|nr:ParB N-terminal domain-containing protein [Chloroflexota bacterium]